MGGIQRSSSSCLFTSITCIRSNSEKCVQREKEFPGLSKKDETKNIVCLVISSHNSSFLFNTKSNDWGTWIVLSISSFNGNNLGLGIFVLHCMVDLLDYISIQLTFQYHAYVYLFIRNNVERSKKAWWYADRYCSF